MGLQAIRSLRVWHRFVIGAGNARASGREAGHYRVVILSPLPDLVLRPRASSFVLVVSVSTVPAMTMEEMQQWAGEQEKIREKTERMPPMFAKQVEEGNEPEGNNRERQDSV